MGFDGPLVHYLLCVTVSEQCGTLLQSQTVEIVVVVVVIFYLFLISTDRFPTDNITNVEYPLT